MRPYSKFLFIIISSVFCLSCTNKIDTEVGHAGALRTMMSGDLYATASLDTLAVKPHLYALGAMENLKGEIQIFESKVSNSLVEYGALAISDSFNIGATLLVYAQVQDWESFTLSSSVKSKSELEIEIAALAKEYGIDSEKPFPFLIEGSIASLSWHVIDWKDGDTVHTHKKHQESGLNGVIENKKVEILGFYSTKHKAVFTHHTTFMHMHFKTKDSSIAGHLDDLVLGEEMILKLPKR